MNQTKNSLDALTSGQRVAKNTLWNLLGGILPLLAGLVAIPLLIKGLGKNRFGVLAIAWMAVGYFSLFDLGLGRALTMLVAEKLGVDRGSRDIPALVWTALMLIALLGVIGAVTLFALSPMLVHRILKIPASLKTEALNSFYVLAVSIPIVISTTGLRGVLQAYERFDLTNIVRIPMGLVNFLGPLLVLPFSNNLFPVVSVLVGGRLLAWMAHLFLCMRAIPDLRHQFTIRRAMFRPLLSFGGWVSVSNIVGPFMAYMDRFFVGALLTMTAVAYYITPYEMVTKLWVIPAALVGVLFPAFSTTLVQDSDYTARLFSQGLNYVFLALFPLTVIIVTLAHEGIELWLGAEFAKSSTGVLQWLAVGVLVNSMAQVPFALVQGAGRPDITAKLHLIELPFYLLAVWWLTITYGINGTAIVWVGRVTVDAIALFAFVSRLLPASRAAIRRMAVLCPVALFSLALGTFTGDIMMKILFLAGEMVAFVFVAWFLILTSEDRVFVTKCLRAASLLN